MMYEFKLENILFLDIETNAHFFQEGKIINTSDIEVLAYIRNLDAV